MDIYLPLYNFHTDIFLIHHEQVHDASAMMVDNNSFSNNCHNDIRLLDNDDRQLNVHQVCKRRKEKKNCN